MASRYSGKLINKNTTEQYKHLFQARGVNFVNQFSTAKIKHPTAKDISKLNTLDHIWSLGDRFYKLASEHYNDPELWWIIAWFNQTPTEAHVKLGDVLLIPFPLEQILTMWRV